MKFSILKPNNYYFVISITFVLTSFIFFLKLPILGCGDVDLWYHLNHGRYIWQNLSLPDSGFFSFIAQDRSWTNYYWLFQLLVYLIYSILGYWGLILLKAILFAGILSVIFCFISKHIKNDIQVFYFVVIF